MTHTKEQFKAMCVLKNLNPRQPNSAVAPKKCPAMRKSARPITRTGKKRVGISVEDPDFSKDPVPKKPRGRPPKRPRMADGSITEGFETTTPAPAKKRGNPNWTKKSDKCPQNTAHPWTWEEDMPVDETPQPAEKLKPRQQQDRNLQHNKDQSPRKQPKQSSANIQNETLENVIQLLQKQNEQIAQQNMLMLDQISQMSDIRKLLIGFKPFFDQPTEVNIRYSRQPPTNTTHGINQPSVGTSMEQPGNHTNHGIDPGFPENMFNQSFNCNMSG